MAASFNRVTLVGNLGRDPEVKNTPSGRSVATFSIATTETWYDVQKQKQQRTDWHLIEVWGKAATLAGEHLKKGRSVLVEGALRTDKYEKDGQTHWRTKVVARTWQFNDSPDKSEPVTGDDAPESPAPGSDPF